MAGKNGPKENSWTTWVRFMTKTVSGSADNDDLGIVGEACSVVHGSLTMMVGVLETHIAVSQSRHMQVRCDLLHFDTAVYPTRRPFLNLWNGRAVRGEFLSGLWGRGEESSDPTECATLIRGVTAR